MNNNQEAEGISLQKLIIGGAVIIFLVVVGLLKLITGSFIAAILLFFIIIYVILRKVGQFVMYPGSSFYSQSDIEMKMGQEITNRISQVIYLFHGLF